MAEGDDDASLYDQMHDVNLPAGGEALPHSAVRVGVRRRSTVSCRLTFSTLGCRR